MNFSARLLLLLIFVLIIFSCRPKEENDKKRKYSHVVIKDLNVHVWSYDPIISISKKKVSAFPYRKILRGDNIIKYKTGNILTIKNGAIYFDKKIISGKYNNLLIKDGICIKNAFVREFD
jgi:hypothetical protein